MARARTTFLNQREAELIHQQSIQCLAEVGVRIRSQSVLKLLDEKGASVDYDAMIAAIPEQMVEQALEMAPKEFTLCGRDPRHDLKLPAHPYPHATTSGLAVFVTDHETEEYRRSTRKDVAEFARLGDSLEAVDFLWTSLTACDVPERAHGPHEVWTTLQNTSKHVQGVTVQSIDVVLGGSRGLRHDDGDRPPLEKRAVEIEDPAVDLHAQGGSGQALADLLRDGAASNARGKREFAAVW